MRYTVFIVLESLLSVEGWVDIDRLNLAGKFLFEGLQSQQVVSKNESLVEQVVVGHPVIRVVGFLAGLQQERGSSFGGSLSQSR